MANTIELSVCSGDAALCQFTLTVCYCLLKAKIMSVFVSCLVSDQLRVVSIKAVHTGGTGIMSKVDKCDNLQFPLKFAKFTPFYGIMNLVGAAQ